MMIIRIKKDKEAKLPKYAKPGDAAMDLTALDWVDEGLYIEYRTGLYMEIPDGYVGLLFPRSSISEKGLILANSVGVIDSGYRGEIKIRFKKSGYREIYVKGDRIAQLMIMPVPKVAFKVVDELSSTERGEGGFGHTNNY